MSDSIQVQFNGKPLVVPTDSSLATVLESVGMRLQLVAVEQNTEIVPREQLATTIVNEGDIIEAVTLVGGG